MQILIRVLLSLSLIISHHLFSMETNDKESSHEQSDIMRLPDELKLKVFKTGLYLIIKNNEIYTVFKLVQDYIRNISLVNQDFLRFASCLGDAAKKMKKKYLAPIESTLDQDQLLQKINEIREEIAEKFLRVALETESFREIWKNELNTIEPKLAKLIIAGVNPNIELNPGYKLLEYLVYIEANRLIPVLLFYGAQATDGFALSNAAQVKNFCAFRLLLKHSANLNVRGIHGMTPLMFLCQQGNKEDIKSLLEYGADVNLKCKAGNTALKYLCERSDKKDIDLLLKIELLLKYDADINVKNVFGCVALNLLCKMGNEEGVKLLLSKGVKVDAAECINAIYFADQFPNIIALIREYYSMNSIVQ